MSQVRKIGLPVWGYALWIAVYYDFQMFVNSIIWRNNVNTVAPVWCDIMTKIQVGANVAPQACALLICICLFNVTRHRGAPIGSNNAKKRRGLVVDILLVIGLPILYMALSIIVQPFRFEIVEEEGCTAVTYSYVTYIIIYVPELAISLVSAFLAP